MEIIKEIYPVGLVDCRIINNKINITYFETNQTLGIKTKYINVKSDIKYKVNIKINGDVNNYIMCKDKDNNQIGSKELIKKEGEYEIIYTFDSYMSVAFYILCDIPYTNQNIRLNLNLIELDKKNIEKKIVSVANKTEKILIVSSGIPQNSILAKYAYYKSKYLTNNNYNRVSLFLDNKAVYDNINIDYDKIDNIFITKLIKEEKFFNNNILKSATISLYSYIKTKIIENLEGEPEYIFCYDKMSILVSKSMFKNSKIISMYSDSIISLYYSDFNKNTILNYPTLFEGKYLNYEKKNNVLMFDKKYEENIKKLDLLYIIAESNDNLEKLIAESNIVIISEENIINELIIRLCNYYFTNILINPDLEEKHLLFSKYSINNLSKQIVKLVHNESELVKYNYKEFDECLKLISKPNKKIKILLCSKNNVSNSEGLKMYYLFNLLKSHNINVIGLFNGDNNNIFNLDDVYNISLNKTVINKFLTTIDNNFNLVITDSIDFIDILYKILNTKTNNIIYTTEKLVNELTLQTLNILENSNLIIENNNVRKKLEEFTINNFIENDLSYLNKIELKKEIFYNTAIIIDSIILENYKQIIINLINTNYFAKNKILLIQDKEYNLEKYCSHPDLIIKTTNNYNKILELTLMSKNIIILDNNIYNILIYNLNLLDRNCIITKNLSISNFCFNTLNSIKKGKIENNIEDNIKDKIEDEIIDKINISTSLNFNLNTLDNELKLLNYITNKVNVVDEKKQSNEYIICIEDIEDNNNLNINININLDKNIKNEVIKEHIILNNKYFEDIYSAKEYENLTILLVNKKYKNKKYKISNKYINNIIIWEINDINFLTEFKDGLNYYFIDNNYKYHHLINKNKNSYIYLINKPKKIIEYNYNYIIYKEEDYIQYLFPNSQIVNNLVI